MARRCVPGERAIRYGASLGQAPRVAVACPPIRNGSSNETTISFMYSRQMEGSPLLVVLKAVEHIDSANPVRRWMNW